MDRYFCVNVSKYSKESNFDVFRPASLNKPKDNSVMFIMEKYVSSQVSVLSNVKNCLIFWPMNVVVPKNVESNNLVVKCCNPHNEFCRFFRDNGITNIYRENEDDYILSNGSFISKKANISKSAIVMPGSLIGGDVSIGDDSYIGSGCRLIGEISIGNKVIIKENTVIGADGLTTDREDDGSAITMPQFGSVVIEDNVQIGANCVIARGAIDETIIHKGSKIDNMCFISHNVEVGENTFVVGETIMFGSSSTGRNVMISGNSTIRNGIHIGDNSLVGMGSVVTKTVPSSSIVKGNPAK